MLHYYNMKLMIIYNTQSEQSAFCVSTVRTNQLCETL